MRAMLLENWGALQPTERDDPMPGDGEVRLRIEACAVCRTDLHVVDGDLPDPALPLVPGHEIVGIVDRVGAGVDASRLGRRVGVPWLGHTCGSCAYCAGGRENLCDSPVFTGYTRDGGFADARGRRRGLRLRSRSGRRPGRARATALRRADRLALAADGGRRPADRHLRLRRRGAHHCAGRDAGRAAKSSPSRAPATAQAQRFARELGATWAGGSDERPARALDAAIIFAPVGEPGAGGPGRRPQGRARRLRRHPHE